MEYFNEKDLWRVVQAQGLASILVDSSEVSAPTPLNTETILEDDLVRLRRIKLSDSQRIFDIFTPHIARLLGKSSAFNSVDEVQTILSDLLKLNSFGLHHTFSIEEKKTGEVIGMTELRSFDLANQTCVTGTWLGEDYWEKGFGYYTRKLLFDYAFKQLNQIRIEAGVRSNNYRAINALLRLNFQIEGRLRNRITEFGKRFDYWLLGLLRDV